VSRDVRELESFSESLDERSERLYHRQTGDVQTVRMVYGLCAWCTLSADRRARWRHAIFAVLRPVSTTRRSF
jgi:hypothetical protein